MVEGIESEGTPPTPSAVINPDGGLWMERLLILGNKLKYIEKPHRWLPTLTAVVEKKF